MIEAGMGLLSLVLFIVMSAAVIDWACTVIKVWMSDDQE